MTPAHALVHHTRMQAMLDGAQYNATGKATALLLAYAVAAVVNALQVHTHAAPHQQFCFCLLVAAAALLQLLRTWPALFLMYKLSTFTIRSALLLAPEPCIVKTLSALATCRHNQQHGAAGGISCCCMFRCRQGKLTDHRTSALCCCSG